MKSGIELIADERQRQLEKGHTAAQDNVLESGELAGCAVAHIFASDENHGQNAEDWWPNNDRKFSVNDSQIEHLLRAGAFIAAEIDRILR